MLLEDKIKIFTGNAHPALAAEIADRLGTEVGKLKAGRFSDGETFVRVAESVRGANVFVIQPTCTPVNDNLVELLIIIDALRRASAKAITAVIPYYAYARQDRKTQPREPITAKLVANIVTAAGATRILTVDLHAGQIQGFFDIPVDHLVAIPLLADYFKAKGLEKECAIVSPDIGGIPRARTLAERLRGSLAVIDKRRPQANVAEVVNVIGEVKGKPVILVDDMIDTAGTLSEVSHVLADMGAMEIFACCTHPVLSGSARERLQKSPIREIVVTNSIPVSESDPQLTKLKVISIAPLLAEAIRRIYEELSVSALFD